MYHTMTQEEYVSKREQLLTKFKVEFVLEYVNKDACFRNVFEMLVRGANPYDMIEQLIIDRKKLIEQMNELAMQNERRIIVSKH